MGTLRGDEEGGLRLSLMGALGEIRSPVDHLDLSVILGTVEDDREQKKVTLTDAFISRQNFGSSGYRHEFYSHRAYWGEHFSSKDELRFQRLRISLSGLPAWGRALTGFQRAPYGTNFSVEWNHPELVRGDYGGGTFLLATACSFTDGIREKRLHESMALVLQPNSPLHMQQIESELLYPLENFFTFATDRPNAIIEVQVGSSPLATEQIAVTGPRTYIEDGFDGDLLDNEMLFTLEDVKTRLGDTLRE
jgi:hypothetical protein